MSIVRIKSGLLVIILSASIISCSSRGPEGYLATMNELFTRTIDAGNTQYTVTLITPEKMSMLSSKTANGTYDRVKYKDNLSKMQGDTYFRLAISRPVAYNSSDENLRMFQYYDTRAREHMLLKVGDSSITPAYIQYESNAGVAPYQVVLVCFHYRLKGRGITFRFDDQLLQHPGLEASYTNEEISKIPALNI